MGEAWKKNDETHQKNVPEQNKTTQVEDPAGEDANVLPPSPKNHHFIPLPPIQQPPQQPVIPPLPVVAQEPWRHMRTEVELLGQPPTVEGPRPRRLPEHFRQTPPINNPNPAPQLPLQQDSEIVEEDPETATAYAEIARAYAASAASSGYSQDPQMYEEAMNHSDAENWNEAVQSE